MVIDNPPIATHDTDYCRVALFGRLKRITESQQVFANAVREAIFMGAHPKKICVLKPASDSSQPGFRRIVTAAYGTADVHCGLEADGVVLHEDRSAIIVPTGDCPAVILNNLETGKMVAVHAGRPALTPSCECDACIGNIISGALVNVGASQSKGKIRAYITGSICPEHFKHDDEHGQTLVRPFIEMFGGQVFKGDLAEGKLDLVKLITSQIAAYTDCKHIVHDGICTYNELRLASHRRGGTKYRNLTIAVNGPF